MKDEPCTFYRDVTNEYCTRIRGLVKELLKGVSESLGLVPCYLEKASELETGLQILIENLYPPCPQPELVMAMPPHSDHGLLTVLMQNNLGGLQVKHNGKWVLVNPLPNSFLVNTGNQLEVRFLGSESQCRTCDGNISNLLMLLFSIINDSIFQSVGRRTSH